jgi:hypothetical protein
MLTKTEQLNQLFTDWENSIPDYKGKFIRDGIINEELYSNANPKVLFIQKEANDPAQTARDLFLMLTSSKSGSYECLNQFSQVSVKLNKLLTCGH